MLPADAVAALRTRSAELTLPADVGAATDVLAPEAAAAGRCYGNVISLENEKSGDWGSDGKPLAALYTISDIVVRLDLWYEFYSDARQHPRADELLLHELQVDKSFLIMQLHFAHLGI